MNCLVFLPNDTIVNLATINRIEFASFDNKPMARIYWTNDTLTVYRENALALREHLDSCHGCQKN